MEDNSKLKKLIIRSVYIIVITLIIAVVALIIFKYNVEGEKNMPFKLSSIIIVSNAEGKELEENSDYLWNMEVMQNNDIYLNIEKNLNYKETEIIESISIDNIEILDNPKVGQIEIYRPSGDGKTIFTYDDGYKVDKNIEFVGDINSDLKNLKISNQGSTLIFRVSNKTGVEYKSNDEIFEHSGKLLNTSGIAYDDIKAKVSFDLIITLESGISYRANIKEELPVGNIAEEGSSNKEVTNMRNIVFKRELN